MERSSSLLPPTSSLNKLSREADTLRGEKDNKLQTIIPEIKNLLKEGYNPILFCRFIPTAEYVAEQLRDKLPKDIAVAAVTGTLPPIERVERIAQLAQSPKRVLVATDCLSEGINLQDAFNAVIHYDLSWNPTRHEQREGRVDRYGQPASSIRVITYYGKDTQIDGIVLNVLFKKHKAIRTSLGISVPIPANAEQVVEAIFEGLLLSNTKIDLARQDFLPGLELEQKTAMMAEWDNATEREKRSRTIFAQNTIRTDDVAAELKSVQDAIGSGISFGNFCERALSLNHCYVDRPDPSSLTVDFSYASPALCANLEYALSDSIDLKKAGKVPFRFELPLQPKERLLTRTHPFVEALANHVLETALDPNAGDPNEGQYARRCGVVKTREVSTRTTLLVLRFRYHILPAGSSTPLLAEECALAAFTGRPSDPLWLDDEAAEKLLTVIPAGNTSPEQIQQALKIVTDGYEQLLPHLDETAQNRANQLLTAHLRVRPGKKADVKPQLPPDVLGFYVYFPVV